MTDTKKELIAALEEAIEIIKQFDPTTTITTSITQYKQKEKEFVTDIHVISNGAKP